MFDEYNKITSIDLYNFNSNEIRNMSYMFSNCSSLKNINLLFIFGSKTKSNSLQDKQSPVAYDPYI